MDSQSRAYLNQYLSALLPEKRKSYQKFDAYYFCADKENANICANLVLKGDKRATAGLLWSYEDENEPLPDIGQLTVVTNWDKEPQCIIETTSIEVKAFQDVDAEFAFEEGEGDKSLEYWRKAHWQFFGNECQNMEKAPNLNMLVVLERFEVVFHN